MPDCYVVLYAATPPDSSKVAALFVVGAEQGDATAKSRAEAFRDAHFPTSVVNKGTVTQYNGPIIINA